jgi:pterin-4a-carbinolamine dehydratase
VLDPPTRHCTKRRRGGCKREAIMAATSELELFCSQPGWQHYGNRIEKTFDFDDFSAAARFVGRMADDAAVAGRQPAIDLRCDRVTVAFAPRDDRTPTEDDLAVAGRIQRLVGDHRHPIGRAVPGVPAEPWPVSARARLARRGPERVRDTCEAGGMQVSARSNRPSNSTVRPRPPVVGVVRGRPDRPLSCRGSR